MYNESSSVNSLIDHDIHAISTIAHLPRDASTTLLKSGGCEDHTN
eukprot:GDKH01025080.1.p1 GENE.GDKH01025080.1~~GDKH01025080.1.p1  ORF type:complete len:54 (+),score=1.19 GDKH01025080.1:28-162(+)